VTESSVVNEWIAMGEAKGELKSCRVLLRDLLEERFGPLPAAVRQRIEAAEDLEQLRAAIRQALRLQSLDQLQL
jgi:hypothetical protein